MNEREEWEINLDHTDVAVRLENDWHGNYAAHTLARLTGVGIAQGPWRATPAAALRAIGINANPQLEPHNCADEIATLRSDLRTALQERDSAHELMDKNRALRVHAEMERDETIAICRGTQMDDAALASMRKYVEQKLRIERELAEARALVKAAYLEGADQRNYVGADMNTDDELWRSSDARKALEEL